MTKKDISFSKMLKEAAEMTADLEKKIEVDVVREIYDNESAHRQITTATVACRNIVDYATKNREQSRIDYLLQQLEVVKSNLDSFQNARYNAVSGMKMYGIVLEGTIERYRNFTNDAINILRGVA